MDAQDSAAEALTMQFTAPARCIHGSCCSAQDFAYVPLNSAWV